MEKKKLVFIRQIFNQPWRLFLILSVTFGLLSLFLTPPFQAPDEDSHFFRAVHISQGYLIPEDAAIPSQLVGMLDALKAKDIRWDLHKKQSTTALKHQFTKPLDFKHLQFYEISNTVEYSPAAYLPQTIGVLLGRLLRLPMIALFYLGRLFNLLAYIVLAFFAIKRTPVFRWSFFLLSLMPMVIFQAASNSPDALLFGISFLVAAHFFYLAFGPKTFIGYRDLLPLAVWLMGLSLMKPGYVILAGLFFMIDRRKFGCWKRYALVTAGMILIVLLPTLIWQILTAGVGAWEPGRQELSAQNAFLSQYWYKLPGMLFSALADQFLENAREMVGVLGWGETLLPGFVYILYFPVMIVSVILVSVKDLTIGWRVRLWGVGIFFGGYLALLFVFSFIWDDFSAGVMHNLQGRYFIPLVSACFPFFYLRKFHVHRLVVNILALVTSLAALVSLSWTLLMRYWAFFA